MHTVCGTFLVTCNHKKLAQKRINQCEHGKGGNKVNELQNIVAITTVHLITK